MNTATTEQHDAFLEAFQQWGADPKRITDEHIAQLAAVDEDFGRLARAMRNATGPRHALTDGPAVPFQVWMDGGTINRAVTKSLRIQLTMLERRIADLEQQVRRRGPAWASRPRLRGVDIGREERKRRHARAGATTMTRETAFHEAGHVVVAAAAGIHVDEAMIHADGGHAKFTGGLEELLAHAAVPTLSAVIAGRLAQQTVNPRADARGWEQDDKYIDAALHAAFDWPTPEKATEIFHQLEALAQASVTVNWKWIEQIAEALLRKKTLTHAQIVRLRPGGHR